MMGQESVDGRNLASRVLPWIVAGAGLAIYLATLNHWVSLLNMDPVASIAGWRWQPDLGTPAYYVVTFPLRWLPAKWIPLALNLFSAVCAALTLAQLVRSVMLLPHDRTHEQRERERSEFSLLSVPLAWLPPVMAAMVCGLQLSFWEHGTNGTVEMFDLLVFAYIIRCVLEYRLDGRESRLLRAAFLYGVGMTNNFAMIAYFPLFLTAIIWSRGLSFFNSRFLIRMAVCGLAGLSLYFLLPLIASLSKMDAIGFWEALRYNLVFVQKSILLAFPRKMLLVISLYSLVPLLLLAIRWSSYFGDPSKVGVTLATWMFHLSHAFFLVAILWVALDPEFISPRNIDLGNPALKSYCPGLTFYYLSALATGYFAGYFLLVFRPIQQRNRRKPELSSLFYPAAPILAIALLAVAIAALAYRNLPRIRTANQPTLQQFAQLLAEQLPAKGVLVSDDPRRLLLLRAWLARSGQEKDFLPLDTQALEWPAYHRYLHRRFPEHWPAPPKDKGLLSFPDTALVELMLKLAKDFEITYLHPSFGYYFEFFYSEPHGLVYKLSRYPADSLLPPPLPPDLISRNEVFWTNSAAVTVQSVAAAVTPPDPDRKLSLLERAFRFAHLAENQDPQAAMVAAFYSRALIVWAVELQKAEAFDKAADRFELAVKLNPKNVVAEINLQQNKNHRAGRGGEVQLSEATDEKFGIYRSWEQVLNENGPYDEPSLTYAQAYTFLQGRLYRQAAQCFDRVRSLSLSNLTSRLWLAHFHIRAGLPDIALGLTREIRAHPERFSLASSNRTDLLLVDATAYFAKKEPDEASRLIEAEVSSNPTNSFLLTAAARLYSDNGLHSQALAILDSQLKRKPDDLLALLNKGILQLNTRSNNTEAIAAFTRVLKLDATNAAALLYRGMAELRTDQLDAAKADYELFNRQFPYSYQTHTGLAEIALRRKDTNAAILHYEVCLTNTPPNAAEWHLVSKRLKELKGGNP